MGFHIFSGISSDHHAQDCGLQQGCMPRGSPMLLGSWRSTQTEVSVQSPDSPIAFGSTRGHRDQHRLRHRKTRNSHMALCGSKARHHVNLGDSTVHSEQNGPLQQHGPLTSTWFQASTQTTDVHTTFSSSTGHRYQHGFQPWHAPRTLGDNMVLRYQPDPGHISDADSHIALRGIMGHCGSSRKSSLESRPLFSILGLCLCPDLQ